MTLLWKPLLASTLPVDYDLESLPYPLLGSTKLDGFRCMIQRTTALTRKGTEFRNTAVQELLGRKEYEGLDGELAIGPPGAEDVFNRTQNVVNTGGVEAAAEFRRNGAFYVIDTVQSKAGLTFALRHAYLQRFLKENVTVRLIKQKPIRNAKALVEFEAETTARGFEGVMLRRADSGPYPQKPGKENRSTLREFELVKWKRFEYADAVIVEIFPLEHNLNEERTVTGKRSTKKAGVFVDREGRIGSALIRDVASGVEFRMTVQRDALQRWAGWKDRTRWAATTVRYKYQLVGTKDKPRVGSCTFRELGV